MAAVEGKFLHIDDGAVRDAAHGIEPLASLALKLFRSLGLTPQQKIHTARDGRATEKKTIDTKRIHD
jgi:hypothetical protein